MSAYSETWWAHARQARDRLAAQLLGQPAVSMIDIGEDPAEPGKLVLRVHVRQVDVSGLPVPDQMDGIPVRLISGDYKLQSN